MSSSYRNQKGSPGCVVAIGASAGGLEAIERFFKALDHDTDTAFVVLQHLDPNQKSLLPELISRWTELPVDVAKAGTRLLTRRIYVREPGSILELKHGLFASRKESPHERDRHPIDFFMSSLANEYTTHAIGIVVSGTGSDGTNGLRLIQKAGGRTLAQEPSECKFSGMPESAINAGVVDRVLRIEEIAAELGKFVECESKPVSETEHAGELKMICDVLFRKSGHDFSAYKKSTVARRVERRLQACVLPDLASYLEHLEKDPNEYRSLLRDLLISVTQFFRDPEAFAALENDVIPKLFSRTQPGGTIRVWVPACATGEEAYTIAMLLKNYQRASKVNAYLQVFATDIDRSALEFARLGVYPHSIAENVPEGCLNLYFTKNEKGYHASHELREMCLFSEHSLLKHPPFSRIDLISCRNLFIYWEPDLQNRILPIFHYALNPSGYLFLGPAENIPSTTEYFRTLDKKQRIFQRVDGLTRSHFNFTHSSMPFSLLPTLETTPPRVQPAHDRDSGRSISTALLAHYAPPAFVVSEHGEIAFYSGRTEKYVELPTGTPTNNLFDLIARPLRPELHALLHRCIKNRTEVKHPAMAFERDGVVHRLMLNVRPMSEIAEEGTLYLVVLQEIEEPKSKDEAVKDGIILPESSPLVQQLEEELRETREHLQSTIEEVKSSNEELLSMNEELQSANEELQTSKEELQSTNEELETVNSELARKVEELDASNSDLQNFFQGTQVPILFLDTEFKIQKFTPAVTKIFRVIPSDLGRGILDISSFIEQPESIVRDCASVLSSLQPLTRELQTKDQKATYLMRVSPYRTISNVIAGVVVSFSEITDRKRAELESAQLAAIVASSADAIISKDTKGIVTSWNESAARMFGYTAEEMIGRSIKIIIPTDRLHEEDMILGTILSGGRIDHYETIRVRKDGRPIQVSVSVSPLRDSTGKIVGAAKIGRDITEQKATENSLREAVRARDEFLSIASHELRTPLTSLKMQAQMRKRRILNGEKDAFTMEKLVHMVESDDRQITRLATLIDDMLDVGRINIGKLKLRYENVDLEALIREVAERFHEQLKQAGCTLNIDVRWPVNGRVDRFRIEQVVTNLISNAIKYGPRKPIEIILDSKEERAILTVKDHGIGIAGSDHARIFKQFERAVSRDEVSGLGLGLYIVREIVTAHHGTIQVESRLGEGSSFIVSLPLHHQEI